MSNQIFLDPLGRPTIKAISDQCFHLRPSVRLRFFQNRAKQNNFQVTIVIATSWIVGLAVRIIHDSCFCFLYEK